MTQLTVVSRATVVRLDRVFWYYCFLAISRSVGSHSVYVVLPWVPETFIQIETRDVIRKVL